VAPDPMIRNADIQTVYLAHALGVAGVLLQAAFIAAIVLLALRRWGSRLPFGAFTVIFGLNAVMVGAARDQLTLVPGAVLAGLIADALVRSLAPSVQRVFQLRLVAFAIPGTYFALYFVNVAMTRGVWWSVPVWSGSIVLAGGIGWLASWLIALPLLPDDRRG